MNETGRQPKAVSAWMYVLAFGTLLAFLALVGWSLFRRQQGAVEVGKPAPAFTLTSFDGQVIDSAALAGRVVVVHFWASWCEPCENEAVLMEAAWQAYREGGEVVFLGVDYSDTEKKALEFIRRFGVTYPNGADLRTTISQAYHISGVPETYFIDRDGLLAYRQIGPFLSAGEIRAVVDILLSQ